MILDKMYEIIKKKAPGFDEKWFLNNQTYQRKAVSFVFYSASLTSFFLLSRLGQGILSIFVGLSLFFSRVYFKIVVAVFADCGLKDGLFYMINQVPIVFLSLLLFSIFLFSQTFLITCPSISKRIKLDYGDSFKKKGLQFSLNVF